MPRAHIPCVWSVDLQQLAHRGGGAAVAGQGLQAAAIAGGCSAVAWWGRQWVMGNAGACGQALPGRGPCLVGGHPQVPAWVVALVGIVWEVEWYAYVSVGAPERR